MESVNIQDIEWSEDWKIIVGLFETIDHFEGLLKRLDVPYLREIHQKILLLNLKKYTWSLQNYIVEKYSGESV